MSSRNKWILLLVVAPLALLAFLVVAVFTPTVQTIAARRALGTQGEVSRVAVGLSGAELEGISYQRPGLKVSIPAFAADVPVWDAANGKIDVRALVARDMRIEIDPTALAAESKSAPTTPTDATASQPAQPFAGVLKVAALPVDLTVNGVDLSGTITVAGPQPLKANFALTGGGLGSGKQGKILLKFTVNAPGAGDLDGTLELAPTLDAAGQLSALALQLAATARGGALTQPTALKAELAVASEGAGESYRVRLASGAQPLVELDARWAPGAADLPGRWKLALADADLQPFLPAAVALPIFGLNGEGELVLSGTERVRVAGQLKLAADALERVGGPALGALALDTRFDVAASASEVQVNAFRVALDAASAPVFQAEASQVFRIDPATRKLTPAVATADLLAVRLLGVPASWLKAFVPDFALDGPTTAAFKIRPEGEGFLIETLEPLVVPRLRYGPVEAPLLTWDSARIDRVRVTENPAGVAVNVGSVRVSSGGVDWLEGELSATQSTEAAASARAVFRLQLGEVVKQPILRGKTQLTAGQLALEFNATAGTDTKARAQVRLTGLRAVAPAGDLPEIALDAEVSRDAAGVVTLQAPLTVKNANPARVSDVSLALTLTPQAAGETFLARLSSTALFVPDLQAFTALAPAAPAPAPGAGASPAASSAAPVEAGKTPTGPLWAGATGELQIDLARIVYAPGIEVLKTKGRVALTRDELIVDQLQTLLGTGGTFDLGVVLKWLAATKSYSLTAKVGGHGLAVGPLLKALKPGSPAPLEGTYELAAAMSGAGADPAGAAAAAAGEIHVRGRAGVVRALNLETNRYAKAGSTLAGLAGLAGALSGNAQLAERGAQVTALNAVARQFSNLSYDEFAFSARRGSDGAIQIGELRLSAPEMKLAGAGSLQALPGLSLVQQPLTLSFELGARGDMARNLKVLRLLSAEADENAADVYAPLVEPLVLDGTLQQIGTSQLMRVLSRVLGQ